MAKVPRPTLNRIPGGGMPVAKQENHIKDLTKLSIAELIEIKDRESCLLSNKFKINRLPDKGQRIKDFHAKVLKELERRSNIDEAVAMFSELNIASSGKNMLNQMEWNNKLIEGSEVDPLVDVLDSDDETEMDPLRLIAQRSMHERKTIILPPEPSLITAEDLEDIKSFSSSDSGLAMENLETIDADIVAIDIADKMQALKPKLQELMEKSTRSSDKICKEQSAAQTPDVEQHVRYLVKLVEQDKQPQREKFKPYQTTISNVHDPEKEKLRKKCKHWEVTAATPPLIQHGTAKMLNIMDSVDLQCSYLTKLKALQEKQASERLAARIERLQERKLQLPSTETLTSKTAFNTYRNPCNHIEGDQLYNDVDEVHDPLDEEIPGGAVNFTVFE